MGWGWWGWCSRVYGFLLSLDRIQAQFVQVCFLGYWTQAAALLASDLLSKKSSQCLTENIRRKRPLRGSWTNRAWKMTHKSPALSTKPRQKPRQNLSISDGFSQSYRPRTLSCAERVWGTSNRMTPMCFKLYSLAISPGVRQAVNLFLMPRSQK